MAGLRKSATTIATAAAAVLALFTLPAPGAQARELPEPVPDFAAAAALAGKLGGHRTAGVYKRDGEVVVAVTDRAAAETVRRRGWRAELVRHSGAELKAIHEKFDKLAGIPNTAWGVDPDSNQVTVEIFDGVPASDRGRLHRLADEYGDAVRVDHVGGTLEPASVLRGGMGITSADSLATCTAGFNAADSSGQVYTLTAGHCMWGSRFDWSVRYDYAYLGHTTKWNVTPGDWALIEKRGDVAAYGTVKYRDGSIGQIDRSRYAFDGESVDRVGTTSQDLVGTVIRPSTTVTWSNGMKFYGMIESDLCAMGGDSGGPLFTNDIALGILSGGTHLDSPCGNYDDQVGRRTFYESAQYVLDYNDLHVY